jgi:hypothetical protein
MNDVIAFTGILDDSVTGIVDEVNVTAIAAHHEISTGPAIKNIVSGIADDGVIGAVTGA